MKRNHHADNSAHMSLCVCQLSLAEKSRDPVSCYISSFVPLLKMTYDDACSRYVELFLEKEGADTVSYTHLTLPTNREV